MGDGVGLSVGHGVYVGHGVDVGPLEGVGLTIALPQAPTTIATVSIAAPVRILRRFAIDLRPCGSTHDWLIASISATPFGSPASRRGLPRMTLPRGRPFRPRTTKILGVVRKTTPGRPRRAYDVRQVGRAGGSATSSRGATLGTEARGWEERCPDLRERCWWRRWRSRLDLLRSLGGQSGLGRVELVSGGTCVTRGGRARWASDRPRADASVPETASSRQREGPCARSASPSPPRAASRAAGVGGPRRAAGDGDVAEAGPSRHPSMPRRRRPHRRPCRPPNQDDAQGHRDADHRPVVRDSVRPRRLEPHRAMPGCWPASPQSASSSRPAGGRSAASAMYPAADRRVRHVASRRPPGAGSGTIWRPGPGSTPTQPRRRPAAS